MVDILMTHDERGAGSLVWAALLLIILFIFHRLVDCRRQEEAVNGTSQTP